MLIFFFVYTSHLFLDAWQDLVVWDGGEESDAEAEAGAEAGAAAAGADAMKVDDGEEDDWKVTGHPWIGKRVRRIFEKIGASDGTITSWAPPDADGDELWRMTHDDGACSSILLFVAIYSIVLVGTKEEKNRTVVSSASLLCSLSLFLFTGDVEDLEDYEVVALEANLLLDREDPHAPFLKYANKEKGRAAKRSARWQRTVLPEKSAATDDSLVVVARQLMSVAELVTEGLKSAESEWAKRDGDRVHWTRSLATIIDEHAARLVSVLL